MYSQEGSLKGSLCCSSYTYTEALNGDEDEDQERRTRGYLNKSGFCFVFLCIDMKKYSQ